MFAGCGVRFHTAVVFLTQSRSSAASDVYKRQPIVLLYLLRSMLGASHAVQNEKKL